MFATGQEPLLVPDHELIQVIGRGSYGEVWLARNAVGTLRAVKIVRRSAFASDRPFLREFTGIRKYEPISRSHDGLVDVLQIGRSESGAVFYYVMELADNDGTGEGVAAYRPATLEARLQNRKWIPVREALAAFQNLGSALGHLHAAGLLHRDVKPSNVIFVNGVAKLADIGLVVEAGGPVTFVGTEGFIPPEGPGTASADIFALGKLMYETVTGLDRNEFPSLPIQRGADNEGLLELNEILLTCCASAPSDRYPSAAELIADLALLQGGRSIRRMRAREQRFKLARRVGLASGLVAMVTLSGWAISERNVARETRLRARAEQAEKEANKARRQSDDFLVASLLAQARAQNRMLGEGSQKTALDAIRRAVHLRGPTTALRTEAATALAKSEFSELRRWLPSEIGGRHPGTFSAKLDRVALPAGSSDENGKRLNVLDVTGWNTATLVSSPRAAEPLLEVGPFDRSGRLLAGFGGRWHVWDAQSGALSRRIEDPGPWRMDESLRDFTSDGRHLVLHRLDRPELIFFSVNGGEDISVKFAAEPANWSLKPGTMQIAWTTYGLDPASNRAVYISDPDGRVVATLPQTVQPAAVVWSPDGRLLAVMCEDQKLRLWEMAQTPVLLRVLEGAIGWQTGFGFDETGKQFASCGTDGMMTLWDLGTGRQLALRDGVWGFGLKLSGNRLGVHNKPTGEVGSSRVDLQACKLEYSIVSPK